MIDIIKEWQMVWCVFLKDKRDKSLRKSRFKVNIIFTGLVLLINIWKFCGLDVGPVTGLS
jgi:hypothetical protein